MKKLLKMTISAVLVFGLAACSSGTGTQGSTKAPDAPAAPKDTSEDDAKKVVDEFWTALETGDVETARDLTTGDALEKVSELTDSLEESTEAFGAEDLSDEVKEKLNKMVRKMFEMTFKDHKIVSAEKVSDTKFNIETTVKYIDGDEVSDAMDGEQYQEFMVTLMTDAIAYSETHTDEEATDYLYGKMVDFMLDLLDDIEETATYYDKEASFVVEKQDGGWIITEFNPDIEDEEETEEE